MQASWNPAAAVGAVKKLLELMTSAESDLAQLGATKVIIGQRPLRQMLAELLDLPETPILELMGVSQPLSVMSAGSVADLGYGVALGGAEAYTITDTCGGPAQAPGPGVSLEGDVMDGPVVWVLPDGTRRVIRLGN